MFLTKEIIIMKKFILAFSVFLFIYGCSEKNEEMDTIKNYDEEICLSSESVDNKFEKLMDEGKYTEAESLIDLCEQIRGEDIEKKLTKPGFKKSPAEDY